MRKVKLGILVNGNAILNKLGNLNLSTNKAWDLVDLLDFVLTKTNKFNKMRDDKVRELGEEDDGKIIIKDAEKIIEANNYINELLNIDEDLTIEIEFDKEELKGFTANELLVLREIVSIK